MLRGRAQRGPFISRFGFRRGNLSRAGAFSRRNRDAGTGIKVERRAPREFHTVTAIKHVPCLRRSRPAATSRAHQQTESEIRMWKAALAGAVALATIGS